MKKERRRRKEGESVEAETEGFSRDGVWVKVITSWGKPEQMYCQPQRAATDEVGCRDVCLITALGQSGTYGTVSMLLL